MLCVNPENGYLAIKAVASDGTCQFTSLYTVADMANMQDQISNQDIGFLLSAVIGAYALVFVIKLLLQQLGYRH